YEHLRAKSEPLLWIPDAVAWWWVKDNNWRERAKPVVRNVVTVGTTQSPARQPSGRLPGLLPSATAPCMLECSPGMPGTETSPGGVAAAPFIAGMERCSGSHGKHVVIGGAH